MELKPGETRHASVILNGRALTYYDVNAKNWHADAGDFTIFVGRSSEEIELTGKLPLTAALNIGVGQ